MPKTNAERQADYRRLSDERNNKDGERRINTFVRSQAHQALLRLAAHKGITQKELLENLLIEADDLIIKGFDDIYGTEFDAYLSLLRSNRKKRVTA